MNRFAKSILIAVLLVPCRTSTGSATCADTPTWISFTPGSAPSARWHSAAVWDSANARMIVHGGWNGSILGDVWSFTPATNSWAQLSPTGTAPPYTVQHQAIYDPVRQRMVVFVGGVYALSLGTSPAWTTLSTTAPPDYIAPDGVAVFDTHRDRMIVVSQGHTDAFSFATNTWSTLPGGGGLVFGGAAGIYDPVNQRVIVFGGYDYASCVGCCTATVLPYMYVLSLNPLGTWQSFNGPRVSDAVAVYDPHCARMIVYGGTTTTACNSPCSSPWGTQWPWDVPTTSNVWSVSLTGSPTTTLLSTAGPIAPARSHHVGVYNPQDNRLITFGGGEATTTCSYRNDTYALTLSDVPVPGSPTINVTFGDTFIQAAWTGRGDQGDLGTPLRWELYVDGMLALQGTAHAPGIQEMATKTGLGLCTYHEVYVRIVGQGGVRSSLSNWVNGGTCCEATCDQTRLGPAREEGGAFPLALAPPHPNPTSGATEISWSIPPERVGERFQIAVFDVGGRKVATVAEGKAEAGSFAATLRPPGATSWTSGAYFVRLQVGDKRLTRSLILGR